MPGTVIILFTGLGHPFSYLTHKNKIMKFKNERHFRTEQEREADKRDEKTADTILLLIVLILLYYLLFTIIF